MQLLEQLLLYTFRSADHNTSALIVSQRMAVNSCSCLFSSELDLLTDAQSHRCSKTRLPYRNSRWQPFFCTALCDLEHAVRTYGSCAVSANGMFVPWQPSAASVIWHFSTATADYITHNDAEVIAQICSCHDSVFEKLPKAIRIVELIIGRSSGIASSRLRLEEH